MANYSRTTTSGMMGTPSFGFLVKPKFVDLVKILDGNFMQVDTKAFETLFSSPEVVSRKVSITLVLGPDDMARSSLCSKLLDHKIKAQGPAQNQGEEKDMSAIFLDGKKLHKNHSIVAYSEPVLGDGTNRQETAHFFIDVWGTFDGHDDPLYIALCGIASVLASNIVYVQPDELTNSTWTWMKKMISVALKTNKIDGLQTLTYFVQDWSQLSKFKAGEQGGQEYLDEASCAPSTGATDLAMTNIPASTVVKNTVETLNCYLFPVKTPETSMNCRQLFQKFKRLITASGSYRHVQGCDLTGSKIAGLFDGLPPLQTLIDFRDEDIFQPVFIKLLANHTAQDVTNNHEHVFIPDEDVQMSEDEDNLQIENKSEVVEETSRSTPYGSFIGLTLDEEDSGEGDMLEGPVTLEDIWKLRQLEKTSKSVPDAQNDSSGAFSSKVDLNNRSAVQPTAEDIIKSIFAKTAIVPPEITENPRGLLQEISASPFENHTFENASPPTKNNEPSCAPSTTPYHLIPQRTFQNSNQQPDVLPRHFLPNEVPLSAFGGAVLSTEQVFTAVAAVLRNSKLQSQTSLVELEQTVIDQVSENISGFDVHDCMTIIESTLVRAFEPINKYQRIMDQLMAAEVYFEVDSELLMESEKARISVLNEIGANMDQVILAELELKLQNCEALFLDINSEVRAVENKSFKYTIGIAEKSYTFHINQTTTNSQGLDIIHTKYSTLTLEAFSKAWNCPESRIFQKHYNDLAKRITQLYEDQRQALLRKQKSDTILVKDIIKSQVSQFKSEIDRNLRNPVFSTQEQYKKVHADAYAEALRLFTIQTDQITKSIQTEYLSKLKTELQSFDKYVQDEISKKITKLSSPPRSQSNTPIPKERTTRSHPTPVGIHFSLDTVSVGMLTNGKFKKMYGPSRNIICFGNEVMIGESHTTGDVLCNLRDILQTEDISTLHPVQGLRKSALRVEEIVALILVKIDQIVRTMLHTPAIKYVIAIPAFFNSTQRTAVQQATQIAGITAVIVRETCGLICHYLDKNSLSCKDKRFLIVHQDDQTCACDISTYKFKVQELELRSLASCNQHSGYFTTTSGISMAADEVKKGLKWGKAYNHKIVLRCTDSRAVQNVNLLRSKFSNAEIQTSLTSSSDVIQGVALLAAYNANVEFQNQWNASHPGGRLMGILVGGNPRLEQHRIYHKGNNLLETEINNLRDFVKEVIAKDYQLLENEKKVGKKACHKMANDIQGSLRISSETKAELQEQVTSTIKEVDAEQLSGFKVRAKVQRLQQIVSNNNL